jgi:hypothetical protein
MISTGDDLDSHSCGCYVSATLMTQKATGLLGESKGGKPHFTIIFFLLKSSFGATELKRDK